MNCKERCADCHADCAKYLAFYAENQQRMKERSKDRNVRDYFGQRKVKVARIFKHKITGSHKND